MKKDEKILTPLTAIGQFVVKWPRLSGHRLLEYKKEPKHLAGWQPRAGSLNAPTHSPCLQTDTEPDTATTAFAHCSPRILHKAQEKGTKMATLYRSAGEADHNSISMLAFFLFVYKILCLECPAGLQIKGGLQKE